MKLHEINFNDVFINVWTDSIKSVFFNAYTINGDRTLRSRFENIETLRNFTEKYLKNNQDVFNLIDKIANNNPEIMTFNRSMLLSNQKLKNVSQDHGFGVGISPDLGVGGLARGLKSEMSNSNLGETNNWSVAALASEEDLVNWPIIKKYFDIICEVWLWP